MTTTSNTMILPLRHAPVWLLLGGLLLAPAGARADAVNELPIELNYRSSLVAGRDKPCLQLTAAEDVSKLKVVLRRTKLRKAFAARRLLAGDSKTFCWRERPGRYEYQVQLQGTYRGSRRQRQVSITINYLPPIKMLLSRDKIDLDHRKLVFQLNHPADRAELVIRGKGGAVLQRVEESFGEAAPGSPLEVSWEATKGEIVRMELKAFDSDGYWVGTAITPWAIEIPHEEVVFERDRWEIRESEAPKLHAAIKQIRKALKEHASELKVKLYVGGFTDTVGSNSHNRTLSQNRARAIARYFRKNGVTIPIYYRGFGEEALAVPTKDQTDEPRNRRAMYVIAAQAPVISKTITWGRWTPVGGR